MVKYYVLDFKGNWANHFPLIAFSYNNCYNSSISMSPLEALYGRRCRSQVAWFEDGESTLLDLKNIYKDLDNV